MNYSKKSCFLLFLLQISGLHARCPSDPNLVCCPDKIWDNESGKCISCVIGYWGINCSTPCRYPSYGKECQSYCSCTSEFCSPSYGCIPLSTKGNSLVTTLKDPETSSTATTYVHSIKKTKSTPEEETTSALISGKFRSTRAHEITAIPQSGLIKTLSEDPILSNTPILLGIFVICVLFLLLFTVLVITQIRYKCSKMNGTLHKQDINSKGNPQPKPYDVIRDNESRRTRTETIPEQRDPPYTGITNYIENEQQMEKTVPKYIEIVENASQRGSTDEGLSNNLTDLVSDTYTSPCTNPTPEYLSLV